MEDERNLLLTTNEDFAPVNYV